MNIAIVHDSLREYGGAERLLQSLLRLYPKAHVYTSYIDTLFMKTMFPDLSPERLHVSLLEKIGLSKRGYLFQFLMPFLWERFDLEGYDVVLSSSSYLLCNTIRVKSPLHIQYIQGPPKNIYAMAPLNPTQKILPYTKYLANKYEQALHSKSCLITNSKHMKIVLETKFGVKAAVVYPPVLIPDKIEKSKKGNYFLIVSRLDDTKEIEVVVKACTLLKCPLKIVGKGSDPHYVQYLHTIAGPNIEFLGFCSDKQIYDLYKNAIAFLFSAKEEDFGIAPVEAMAHGVPVIAYFGGGVKETVIEGVTGTFFHTYSTAALIDTLRTFSPDAYHPSTIYSHAKKFSEKKFHRNIQHLVEMQLQAKKIG